MTFREFYQKISSRIVWGNFLAMFLLGVAIVVGMLAYLSHYTHHGETITVPSVVGLRSDVAQERLEALGLRAEISDTGHITTMAPDIILEQHIEAGTEVKANRLVRLTVNSAQARRIPLPNVIDGSLREAEMRLKAIGFRLGDVKRIDGDLDLVMRLEIRGREVHYGERVSVEDPITIVAGNGITEDTFIGDDSLEWVIEQEMDFDQGNYE